MGGAELLAVGMKVKGYDDDLENCIVLSIKVELGILAPQQLHSSGNSPNVRG